MQRGALLGLVFVAGAASLATEFGASRLLAPYFGDSLYVWGVVIGLILIYLSVGYVVGGRIADRWPRSSLLFQIVGAAGLWIALIPLVSYPILLKALEGFATISAGLVLSTLVSVVLLFAVPVIMLGCVSPFAIRLLLRNVESGGNTAGFVYALSTGGSILGTFLPVFYLIPTFGTRATLIGFGVVLLVAAALGMIARPRRAVIGVVLAAAVVAASALFPHGIKPPERGALLYERESAYNYIQVVREGSEVQLILNEGQAVHSIYDPHSLTTRGYWDDMLLAPSFRPAQSRAPAPRKVAVLGMAGGTVARQYVAGFGRGVAITGVELDPAIVNVGYRYFDLAGAHANVVVQDARYWLATRPADDKYDVILVDAYRQPYIPFHLTTEEFFRLARSHLTPGGVLVVNVGRTATDYRLVDAIASTMRPVYDNVYLLDPPVYQNTLVYGTTEPTTMDDITHNIGLARGPLLGPVATDALAQQTIRPSPYHARPFTDDLAPVENLINSIIFDVATGRDQE
jgi:predicted membrane-bound spermidine synthase